jgi:uncharacterized RDD family membrane protein YckC
MSAPEPPNPYAPPAVDVNAPPVTSTVGPRLAERRTRLGSAMLDGLLYMLAFIPGMVHGFTSGALKPTQGREPSTLWWLGAHPLQLVTIAAWIVLMCVQAYLVATTGQSIGKRLTGIRIVKLDDSPVGFVDGVLLRGWLFGAIGWIPKLGGVFGLVDLLLIFRKDRRCAHDLVAKTKVIVKG